MAARMKSLAAIALLLFAVGVMDIDSKSERLWKIIQGLMASEQAKAVIRAEGRFVDNGAKVRGILEGLSLIQYISGSCSNCKKLGGA